MKPPIACQLHVDETKLPAEIFERLSHRGAILKDRGGVWAANMKLAQLRNHWDQVVGEAIANHSAVADFTDGVLTIRAESTVWATQLTYLIPQLTDTIRRNLKGLTINEIRVTGPAVGYSRKWARRR